MRKLSIGCCLLMLVLPGLAAAADEQEATSSELKPIGGLAFADEVEVTVVNIEVYVTDKQGEPVDGLSADDFKLYQDGTEKAICNFEVFTEEVYQQAREQIPEPGIPPVQEQVSPDDELKPVHIVLYVDNENLHPLQRNRVLSQARDFVRTNLHPPVKMMVVSYQRSFKVHQSFTSDSGAVLGALTGLRKMTGSFPTRTSNKHDIIEDMQQKVDEEQSSIGSTGSRSSTIYQETYSRILSYADEEYNTLAFSIDALREVISMISGLPGRKAIVYISNGLPMVPGLELFSAYADLFHDHSILGEMSRYDRSSLFKSLVSAANAQDITFYTIAAGGLEVIGMSSAEYRSAQAPMSASIGNNNYIDSLRFMADGTGGLAVVNTNDFAAGLERVARDIYCYYSLGYNLSMSGADKVHRIKVELPDHKEYKLRFRERVVERSLYTRVQDRVLSGLMFDLDENPMELELEAFQAAPAAENRWMLPVHITFPLPKVAVLPEGEDYVGRVMLFVAARDWEGKQSDLVRQEHDIRLPASTYEQATHKRFAIDVTLLMEPGSYRVTVGMLDLLTRQASYETLETRLQAR